jgi:hypothetical protein
MVSAHLQPQGQKWQQQGEIRAPMLPGMIRAGLRQQRSTLVASSLALAKAHKSGLAISFTMWKKRYGSPHHL